MARWLALCGLLCSSVMTGCVGEVDLQVLRADMETLQQNYSQHDAQVVQQLERLEAHLAQPQQAAAQTTSTIVELRAEVQDLKTTLQELQDTVDNGGLTAAMREQLATLETRLVHVKRLASTQEKPAVERQKKPPSATSPPVARKRVTDKRLIAQRTEPQPLTPQPVADPTTTAAKAAKAASAKPSPPALQPSTPVVSTATAMAKTVKSDPIESPSAVPEPSRDPQTPPSDDSAARLYERALRAYLAGNYEDSLTLLKRYLKQYKQSPLAGNVQYWIGESLFAQRQYQAAIVAFDDVVQKYPNNTKVPAAMLNQGLAFAKLQNVGQARFFLQQVQEKYANTLEAHEATATLQQMQR